MRGTATEAAEGSEATGTIRSEAGEVVAVAVDAGVGTSDHATYILSSATPSRHGTQDATGRDAGSGDAPVRIAFQPYNLCSHYSVTRPRSHRIATR
jgi:ABC-type thiamine transport system ATPase subunit